MSVRCLCVSEPLADGVVHDAAPLDVVSVHGGSVEGCQHTSPCLCVLEDADHEGVDSLPALHVVEQSRKLLLSWCECVCHVCHVFVCLEVSEMEVVESGEVIHLVFVDAELRVIYVCGDVHHIVVNSCKFCLG